MVFSVFVPNSDSFRSAFQAKIDVFALHALEPSSGNGFRGASVAFESGVNRRIVQIDLLLPPDPLQPNQLLVHVGLLDEVRDPFFVRDVLLLDVVTVVQQPPAVVAATRQTQVELIPVVVLIVHFDRGVELREKRGSSAAGVEGRIAPSGAAGFRPFQLSAGDR